MIPTYSLKLQDSQRNIVDPFTYAHVSTVLCLLRATIYNDIYYWNYFPLIGSSYLCQNWGIHLSNQLLASSFQEAISVLLKLPVVSTPEAGRDCHNLNVPLPTALKLTQMSQ
jgi:hypothetical protein